MASPQRRFRVLAGAWLILAGTLTAALAGEVWLRSQRFLDARASERFRAGNVFFANAMELQAGTHSLWADRWHEYQPGATVDVVVGGERFVVEMNSADDLRRKAAGGIAPCGHRLLRLRDPEGRARRGPSRAARTVRRRAPVSPDGRSVLFSQRDEVASDIKLVENFDLH